MISKEKITQQSPVMWEIQKIYRPDMLVPARFFATENMLNDILKDRSLDQLINVTTLPGILGYALAMPDIHEGYGFPIGGVAATAYPNGAISPGGIGYDINCGVRLLRSNLSFDQVQNSLERLSQRMYHAIPSGVGSTGALVLIEKELDKVLAQGAQWALEHNYATHHDLIHTESHGNLDKANPALVSQEAKTRGLDQLGTLGSGNHFAEVDIVQEIYDEQAANTFGLWKNQLVVLIHTGSRGLGHQVATDYIRIMMDAMSTYNITVPDHKLACAPLSSPEGQNYFNAMSAAANYAWVNRQIITHLVRQEWTKEFGPSKGDLTLVYDLAHNIAKIETHYINDKKQKVIVHRKGATRAFGPGHPEIPLDYQAVGQPVIIPGSMGTSSYVLVGTKEAMNISLGSACHGAGRCMSRQAAQKLVHGRALHNDLLKSGIYIQAGSWQDLAQEAPFAYKNIDDVVNVVDTAGIARKVAKLKPCVVIKG